jgi:hypothetical protein
MTDDRFSSSENCELFEKKNLLAFPCITFIRIFFKILFILDIQQSLIQQQFHHDIMVEIDFVADNIDQHQDSIEYCSLFVSSNFFI